MPALLADTTVFFLTMLVKFVALCAIFEFKILQNAFAAGASPRTPMEALTALLEAPYSWFSGGLFAAGEGRGGNGRGGE